MQRSAFALHLTVFAVQLMLLVARVASQKWFFASLAGAFVLMECFWLGMHWRNINKARREIDNLVDEL